MDVRISSSFPIMTRVNLLPCAELNTFSNVMRLDHFTLTPPSSSGIGKGWIVLPDSCMEALM